MVRIKLRYLTCKVWRETSSSPRLRSGELAKAIKEAVQANFGDFGISSNLSSMQVRYFDEGTQVFILRCKREYYRSIWAAMTLLTSICGQATSISVLSVSSSVRTCREESVAVLLAQAGVDDKGSEAALAYVSQVEGAIRGV